MRFLSETARRAASGVPECIVPAVLAMMDFHGVSKNPNKVILRKLKVQFTDSAKRDFGYTVGDCFNLIGAAYFIENKMDREARHLLGGIGDQVRAWIPRYVWEIVEGSVAGRKTTSKKKKPAKQS